MHKLHQALIKSAVVLVPTYSVAYATGKMIYVVPMLAASAYVAAALFSDDIERRVDEDGVKEESD